MIPEIYQLSELLWTPSSHESQLLSRLGYEHGFGGVGQRPPQGIFLSRQTHGVSVIDIRSPTEFVLKRGTVQFDRDGLPEADSQVTRTKGQIVAVRTADCLPILIVDQKKRQVSAVHAGWRGLTRGIIRETLGVFFDAGVLKEDLQAVIGPAISRECYEVGPDVVQAVFGPSFDISEQAALLTLAKGRGDRWHFDLAAAAALHLLSLGLLSKNIEVIHACTYRDHRFNSYRRNQQKNDLNWSWLRL